MPIAIYEGDFDDLSGGVVFSWFISNPGEARRPSVGFVEVADTTAGARLRRRPSTKARVRNIPP